MIFGETARWIAGLLVGAVLVLLGLGLQDAAMAFGESEPKQISWSQLPDPATQSFDDPFRKLRPSQLEGLRKVARLEKRLQQAGITAASRDTTTEALEAMIAALSKEGIDAKALIAKRWEVADRRRNAASQGNPEFNGEIVELVGFTLPTAAADKKTFFIISDPMKCSHVSPPAPNQIVRVSDQAAKMPNEYFVPVKIRGKIRIAPGSERVFLIDGARDMQATFSMELEGVEVLGKARPPESGNMEARSFMGRGSRQSPALLRPHAATQSR